MLSEVTELDESSHSCHVGNDERVEAEEVRRRRLKQEEINPIPAAQALEIQMMRKTTGVGDALLA
jgi:hypothetical protein